MPYNAEVRCALHAAHDELDSDRPGPRHDLRGDRRRRHAPCEPRPDEDLPAPTHGAAAGLHARLPAARSSLSRARAGDELRLRPALGDAPWRGLFAAAQGEGGVDRGQPVLRARRGRRRRHPVAGRLRRHPRRRLEREGGPGKRRPLRPEAVGRARPRRSRATSSTSPRARSGARGPSTSPKASSPTSTDDGKREFGEVLPDARVFKASADAFDALRGQAGERRQSLEADAPRMPSRPSS